MTESARAHHEVVVVGAGIAGLWTYNRLRAAGRDAILIDTAPLGGMQSLASQGMIHGGQRYALEGKKSEHSEGIAAMPGRWNAALAGAVGEPDLSTATILSPTQILWSPGGLTSAVTSFFASKAMNSRVEGLPRAEWPAIFRDHPKFSGKIYAMDEVVVDVRSVSRALVAGEQSGVRRVSRVTPEISDGRVASLQITELGGGESSLTADRYVFTAGLGNEEIVAALWPGERVAQRRPLRQVLVDDVEYALYGHCITVDPRPRVTVSAHPLGNGRFTWYLGGLVAVKNVDTDDAQAIAFARRELETLFPHVAWGGKKFYALYIERAEPYSSTGFLPEGPTVLERANAIVAWPTKLTFAPAIADRVLAAVDAPSANGNARTGAAAPDPEFGRYPWEPTE